MRSSQLTTGACAAILGLTGCDSPAVMSPTPVDEHPTAEAHVSSTFANSLLDATIEPMGWYDCHYHYDPPPPDDDPPVIVTAVSPPAVPGAGREKTPRKSTLADQDVTPSGWECHYVPGSPYPGDPDAYDPGGGGSVPPDVENDPHHGAEGSLWYDVVDGLAMGVPDCSKAQSQLHAVEWDWCNGDAPTGSWATAIDSAAAAVLQRCSHLSSEWQKVQGNIRLFHYSNQDYGGGTRLGDDWMLISYEWVTADAELIVAHELLHVEGHKHDSTSEKAAFKAKEEECSGGRST